MVTTATSYLANVWHLAGTALDTKSLVLWIATLSVAGLFLLRYDPR